MVAGQPHDACIRCGLSQFGAQRCQTINGGLCRLLIGGAGAIFAEFGPVQVVADQHHQRRIDVCADGECYRYRCFVVDRLQLAVACSVIADLHIGQDHAVVPAVGTCRLDLAGRQFDRRALLHDRPLRALRPVRRQLHAGHVDGVGFAFGVFVEALPQVDLGDLADVVDVDAVPFEQLGNLAECG